MTKKASPTHTGTVAPAKIITAVVFCPGCRNRFKKKFLTIPAVREGRADVIVVDASCADPASKGKKNAMQSKIAYWRIVNTL